MIHKNPRPLDIALGRAIRFWRDFDGISQGQLARRMQRPYYYRAYISRVEGGQHSLHLVQFERFAEALHISPYILALTMEALAPGATP